MTIPDRIKVVLKDADIAGTVSGMPGIAKHTSTLAGTFERMVSDLQAGNARSVIEYLNRGSVKADVEAVLGRALTRGEAIEAGTQAPSLIDNMRLSRACTIARELQTMRALARKTCQMYQAHGFGSAELHRKLTGFITHAIDVLQPEEEEFETW